MFYSVSDLLSQVAKIGHSIFFTIFPLENYKSYLFHCFLEIRYDRQKNGSYSVVCMEPIMMFCLCVMIIE